MHLEGTPAFSSYEGKDTDKLEAAKESTSFRTERCFSEGSSSKYTFLAVVVIAQNLGLSRKPSDIGDSF